MDLFKIKEKSEIYGENNLNDIELLSIILGKSILTAFISSNVNSFKDLFNLSNEDLLSIKGFGKSNLIKINAIKELYKRKLKYEDNIRFEKPKDIYDNNLDMSLFDQEVLRLICLNTKNKIICKEDIFKGSLNSSIVHPREIYKQAINKNSACIVVCHNHPSGDPEPSREDINITLRLKECGEIIGIKLLDHIIIGNNRYISLKEREIL